ncbi:MAG: ABC transporter ATP-binding protein, partial [Heyndrickxia sp.]
MKNAIIHFDHFTFQYRSQSEPTLHDINLTIYEGEKVLIVGPSGSGKSTLAHCINGLVPFSYSGKIQGSLKIKEKETKELDLFSISKMVGTVLQDPDGQFIGLSVAEDIAFALENDCIEQTQMEKQVVDVSKLIDMENYLEASIHELSGGQKQRVALGGVMVDQVEILLFDEPLANLDPATGKHAIELIDHIKKETNTTVIIVEHRLEDVLHRDVDRIIVMNEGRIVSDTTPDELLASSILEKYHIREPLYVKALKYAGCTITKDMHPADLNQINIYSCKEEVQKWFEKTQLQSIQDNNSPILVVENLTFGYQTGKSTLQDISFSIKKGEMVSIVGKN